MPIIIKLRPKSILMVLTYISWRNNMKKIKTILLPLSLLLSIPIINNIYGDLNNSARGVHYLVTYLDKKIPFISEFSIPYLMLYPFILFTLIYFCIYYRKVYFKVMSSIIIGMVIFFIIYYMFQTSVPRPQLYGNSFFTNLVKYIYINDNPFNCFPSTHVFMSYLMIKGIKDTKKEVTFEKVFITTISIAIILSTQFIKQHVILDMIFAILLGEGIYRLVNHISLEGSLLWIKKLFWWLMTKKKLEI